MLNERKLCWPMGIKLRQVAGFVEPSTDSADEEVLSAFNVWQLIPRAFVGRFRQTVEQPGRPLRKDTEIWLYHPISHTIMKADEDAGMADELAAGIIKNSSLLHCRLSSQDDHC